MDLVEAFRTLQPIPPNDRALAARIQRAAAIVYETVQGYGRYVRAELRDDVVQTTMFYLTRRGPQDGPSDPDTEPRVRAYLHDAIKKNELTAAKKKGLVLDPSQDYRVEQYSPEQHCSPDDDSHLALLDHMCSEIVPRIAGRMRRGAGATFTNNFEKLLSARMNETTLGELARQEAEPDANDAELKNARERIDTRNTRVRKRLLKFIRAEESARRLDSCGAATLRVLVEHLRFHASPTPKIDAPVVSDSAPPSLSDVEGPRTSGSREEVEPT